MSKTWSILIAISILSTLGSLHVSGESSGLNVYNLPPSIGELTVRELDGNTIILLNITDFNSYRDLRSIYINISDGTHIISSIAYIQGSDDNSTGYLENVVGSNLLTDSSNVTHGVDEPGLMSCYLQLKICFKPVKGIALTVVIHDMAGQSAIYEGPYSIPPLDIGSNMNILLLLAIISVSLAILFQLHIMRRRVNDERS
jgi:hypothetical protein